MGPSGPLAALALLALLQAAGEAKPPQNLTCNPGGSVGLCLDPPGEGSGSSPSAHLLLWSASWRKGLALWVPGGQLYVVSPSHSGRITRGGNRTLRINDLKPDDRGLYEVLVRTPGRAPNQLLLEERTWYSFDISLTTASLANDSCTLELQCEEPPLPYGVPGSALLGYAAAKVALSPPPLLFLFLYWLRRDASRQKRFRPESFPMGPPASPLAADPAQSSPLDPGL